MQKLRRYHNLLRAAHLRTVLLRGAILTVGFWALAEGNASAFLIGAAVVVCSLLVSLRLSPRPIAAWRPLGILRFAVFFLGGSLRGGIDVARRALSPGLPISPTLIHFRSRLEESPALDLFTSTVSLMPGALGVERDGNEIDVHVLVDDAGAHIRQFETLETVIAHALGIRLSQSEATDV